MIRKAIIIAASFSLAVLSSCSGDKQNAQPGNSPVGAPSVASTEEDPPAMLNVDKQPTLLKRTEPRYPEVALKAGIQGTIYTKVLVGKDGSVKKVEVSKREDGSPDLEQSAIEAAKQWTFSPAELNGQPVAAWVVIPFKFKLSDEPARSEFIPKGMEKDPGYLKGYIAGLKRSSEFYSRRAEAARQAGKPDSTIEMELASTRVRIAKAEGALQALKSNK